MSKDSKGLPYFFFEKKVRNSLSSAVRKKGGKNSKMVILFFYSGHALHDSETSDMLLKQREQTIVNEHNMVKIANWWETNHLAIYRAWRS